MSLQVLATTQLALTLANIFLYKEALGIKFGPNIFVGLFKKTSFMRFVAFDAD
jgi:hypothetical protein